MGTRDPGLAAFSRLPSLWHGNLIEVAFLLSRAGSYRQEESSAIYSFCKNNLHNRNREEILIKTWPQTIPIPGNDTKILIRADPSTWKCVFIEINIKACMLMFPRYFHYSIGSTGQSQGPEAIEALTILIHIVC